MDTLHDRIQKLRRHASDSQHLASTYSNASTKNQDLAANLWEKIQRDLCYRNIDPSEVSQVYLVGAGAQSCVLIEQLSQLLPALRLISIFASDEQINNLVNSPLPELSGALSFRDCFCFSEENESWFARYVSITKLITERSLNPRHALLVLVDPSNSQIRDQYQRDLKSIQQIYAGYGFTKSRILAKEKDWLNRLNKDGIRHLVRWCHHLIELGENISALSIAYPLYSLSPNDELATCIVSAWLDLACPGRALEWLERSSIAKERHAVVRQDLDSHRKKLEEIRQQNLISVFQRLAPIRPEFVEAIKSSEEPSNIELGFARKIPWRLYPLGPNEDPEVLTLPVPLKVEPDSVTPLATLQTDFAETLRELTNPLQYHCVVGDIACTDTLANLRNHALICDIPNWERDVCILAADLGLCKKILSTADSLTELLENENVDLHYGTNAYQHYISKFEESSKRALPAISSSLPELVLKSLKTEARRRQLKVKNNLAQIRNHYTSQFPASVAKKIAAKKPLNILLISSRHTNVLQYIAGDLQRAFIDLGHNAKLLIENNHREQINHFVISKTLIEHNCDLLVLIDHLKAESPTLFPEFLPSASWILDELPPLKDPQNIARLRSTDAILFWSRDLEQEYYQKYKYPHASILPHAVCTKSRYPIPNITNDNRVAYATNVIPPTDPPSLKGFIQLCEQKISDESRLLSGLPESQMFTERLLQEFYGDRSFSKSEIINLSYLCLLTNRHLDRCNIARQLLESNIPMALYGSGWDQMPEFREHACGYIKPGPELNRMYQRHLAVLHVNRNSTFHPRVLECIAAGGLILARSNDEYDYSEAGIDQHLKIGSEICIYKNDEDLIAKIQRARSDQAWRQGFIERGRLRVLRDHNYLKRAQEMIDIVQHQLEKKYQTSIVA